MNSRFKEYRNAHEILDEVIDEWCERERRRRIEKGLPPPKKSDLKTELGRAVGLGNGDDEKSAGKGIYRYCSGETPISIEKALQICNHIDNHEIIQWIGYQAGMLMTPRAAIDAIGECAEEDVFEEIVRCLKQATRFIETLSNTYQAAASLEAMTAVEEVFMRSILQMEKTRLMLKRLLETMISPGTQRSFWFGIKDPAAKGKKGKGESKEAAHV